jgi:peptidoglycan-associated lipoprotein
MHFKISRLMVLVLVGVLAGCSSKGGTGDGAAVDDKGTSADGAVSSGAEGYARFASHSLDDPSSPLARRVIYFEYDSTEIAPEDHDLVLSHSGYLAGHPEQQLTLEGHADERGSREYNIGLGDRRAQAVRRIMELNGVSASQISVVSYGEEKPAAEGQSEAAWRLNRRVELVY